MKKAFEKIPTYKREKIIQACIDEFSTYGYDKSSTDRIIKNAGISKGGLYEYISSKEDLFLYIVEYTYSALYGYLNKRIVNERIDLPADLLERFRLVSKFAIDFYIDHPQFVSLIVNTYQLLDEVLEQKVQLIFRENFFKLFGSVESQNLRVDKNAVMELAMWLLLKTRYDFLKAFQKQQDVSTIREEYLKNWDFYLSVLKEGIYRERDAKKNFAPD